VSDENPAITMNQVADQSVLANSGESVVAIEGISNGIGDTNELTLDFENSNPGLFGNISISSIGTDGTASLNFTPAVDQVGVAKIKLILTKTGGITRQVVFYVTVHFPTDVKALNNSQYKIYPNPVRNQLNLELPANQFRELSVTDVSGRLILSQKLSSNNFPIDVSNWSKGIYILKLKGDNISKVDRFVVE
jgi:hypothetical protein